MNMLPATHALEARHMAYNQRRRLLCLANGPALTPQLSWPAFWDHVNRTLRSSGYSRSTRLQYRRILHAMRKFGVHRPAELTPSLLRDYIASLTDAESSWSWIALHITALRTIFDRLCGLSLTAGIPIPKRPLQLPEILSRGEAERLVRAGTSIRDQLILGLLYGGGLTGSEVCRLRWQDVRDDGTRLHIQNSTRYLERIISAPDPLQQILRTGVHTCESIDHIFCGRREGTPISTRMIELIVKRACKRADIQRPVCVTTLRHSCAVHHLEAGTSRPQLQAMLGLASIRTTERYLRCIAPTLDTHPLTKVRALMTPHSETPTCPPSPLPRPLEQTKSIDVRRLRLPFAPTGTPFRTADFVELLKSHLCRIFQRAPGPP